MNIAFARKRDCALNHLWSEYRIERLDPSSPHFKEEFSPHYFKCIACFIFKEHHQIIHEKGILNLVRRFLLYFIGD